MKRALSGAALCAALMMSSAALAQSAPPKKPPPPPPPSSKDVIDSVSASPDVEDESKGNYPDMKREESLPLGQIQRAWDKAPGKDGVYHVEWSADKVIKIRVRQYMPVTIVFPEWEGIGSEPESGDSFVFGAERVGTNKLVIRAKYVGADAAITVIGDSGNVYAFYVRAEGANSGNIPDVVVYVHAAPPTGGMVVGSTPAEGRKGAGARKPVEVASAARMAIGEKSPDFAKGIPFDPGKLSFEFDMSGDSSIAPKRVFSDGIFTWFDYGDRWDRSDLPAVYRVVDGVDTPVNTRVKGTMLVAEAAGAFTDAAGADQMARTGFIGDVDIRMWERYGSAFIVAAISSLASLGNQVSANQTVANGGNALSQNLGQVTAKVLEQSVDLAPIVTVPAGSRVQIIPGTDLWIREPEQVSPQTAGRD